MANDYYVGTWRPLQVQAQDGTALQPKKNDIADMTIERDMFGYLNGYMERRKMFGRTARMDIVVSELENTDAIRVLANFDTIIAEPDINNGNTCLTH